MTRYFRVAFAVALVLVTHLTTTAVVYPGTEGINDKLAHFLAFAVLGGLADFSFPRSGFAGTKVLGLLGYGLAIEILQYFIPARSFSLLDLAADGAGLAAYALLIPLLKKLPAVRKPLGGSMVSDTAKRRHRWNC